MTAFGDNVCVFIVRVWREPREIAGASAQWRGVIEHVPSSERRYVKDVDEITAFIACYLHDMGVKLDTHGRARKWLNRLKLHFKA